MHRTHFTNEKQLRNFPVSVDLKWSSEHVPGIQRGNVLVFSFGIKGKEKRKHCLKIPYFHTRFQFLMIARKLVNTFIGKHFINKNVFICMWFNFFLVEKNLGIERTYF